MSANLLAILPEPSLPSLGDSFQDQVLLLLAAVATTDQLLTYRDYQLAQEAVISIFGENALHAQLQAKLHAALLNPPSDPVLIAKYMSQLGKEEKISADFIQAVLQGLNTLTKQEPDKVNSNQLVEDITLALTNIDKPENFNFSFPSFSPLNNFPNNLGSMYKKATEILWAKPSWLKPETALFNENMLEFTGSLERVALTLNDQELDEKLQSFKKILKDQPYKIVIIGERKRGKSSLINTLLGQELSPVAESTPETATIMEFHYAPAPSYLVSFLDTIQFNKLEAQLTSEQDNLVLQQKIQHVRNFLEQHPNFTAQKNLTSWSELADYVSLNGYYSNFVAKVQIGLPLSLLQSGITMADTPGINDTDQFHDYLTYQEAISADCLIFVLDARDPGSYSELQFLQKLLDQGRAINLIGVLTNIDRLNDPNSLEIARAQATQVLQEAGRSSNLQLAGVVALNTRSSKQEKHPELATLLNYLQAFMRQDNAKALYRHKLAKNFDQIVEFAKGRVNAHLAAYKASLPDPNLLSMLDSHASTLAQTSMASLSQAKHIISITQKDLDSWEEDLKHAISNFEETLILRLMDAINQKANALGNKFAQATAWKSFDAIEAKAIATQTLDEFLATQRQNLETWEAKLNTFANSMDEFTAHCFNQLTHSIDNLDQSITEQNNSRATNFLVQTHRHMKNLTVFTAGLSVGRLTALGPLTLLVTAGNIIALAAASPLAAVIFAGLASTAGLIYHLGNEDKQKQAFLEKKRKQAESYAHKLGLILTTELNSTRVKISQAYAFEIERGFTPALQNLFYESAHIRLFVNTMQRIHSDAEIYAEHVQKKLVG